MQSIVYLHLSSHIFIYLLNIVFTALEDTVGWGFTLPGHQAQSADSDGEGAVMCYNP